MFHPLYNLDPYDVILASASPRRSELLKMLDISFRVDTSYPVEEIVPENTPAEIVPGYLSRLKAEGYPLEPGDMKLVIAADTVVILDDEVIGKPLNLEGATAILAKLQGRTHRVVSGVTIRTFDKSETFSSLSEVEFAPLTPEEIAYYVDTYRPLDKAGAYGIQEWIGAAAIKGIKGSFYNVMGLPVHRLYQSLKQY